MIEVITEACCGICEIDGLSSVDRPSQAFRQLVTRAWDDRNDPAGFDHAHYIFTQATRNAASNRYGAAFAAFIRRNKLGTCAVSPTRMNPSSLNDVTAWIFTPNNKACAAYIRRHKLVVGFDDDEDY